jgi:hypothetical protein
VGQRSEAVPDEAVPPSASAPFLQPLLDVHPFTLFAGPPTLPPWSQVRSDGRQTPQASSAGGIEGCCGLQGQEVRFPFLALLFFIPVLTFLCLAGRKRSKPNRPSLVSREEQRKRCMGGRREGGLAFSIVLCFSPLLPFLSFLSSPLPPVLFTLVVVLPLRSHCRKHATTFSFSNLFLSLARRKRGKGS